MDNNSKTMATLTLRNPDLDLYLLTWWKSSDPSSVARKTLVISLLEIEWEFTEYVKAVT